MKNPPSAAKPVMPPPLTDLKIGLTSEYVFSHQSPKKKRASGDIDLVFDVLKNQISSIFFILLLVSALLSWALGHMIDASIFIVINAANVILGFIQEFKASKASKTLEKMISHQATVVRDGKVASIDSEAVIQGDIIMLAPGDILVADVIVRTCADAMVDESLRTGESAPVDVQEGQSLYAGSSIVAGRVTGQVTAASDSNSLVAYSHMLKGVKKNNSFAQFVSSVSVNILCITLLSLLLIGIFSVFLSDKYSPSEFILFAISMLVGVVPESLPLIITLMLTREALSLSKEQVLVKRLAALQQLGSIKYLLTDKTGTLTENKVRLSDDVDVSELRLKASMIATAPYERTPMDSAFDSAIQEAFTTGPSETIQEQEVDKDLVEVTPFKNSTGYAIYTFKDQNQTIIRGQYKAVIALCPDIAQDAKKLATFDEMYKTLESKGLRVIALAYRTGIETVVKAGSQSAYTFSGLLIFEDPLKVDAPHSYKAAEGLGISVKVLTGDSPLVAQYIAAKLDSRLGADNVCSVDTVPVSSLTDADLEKEKVYARCQPTEKLELIDRHLQHGAVGFLGEGINDALALKRADVGLVVHNASDVARQSADILLMEKSLNPVIKAIQMSRRVYAHISTYLLCTLTGNIGTLFSLTAVALFWKDLPMLPVQILLNNLLTDVPLLLLITDRLAKEAYNKPIEQSSKNLFKTMILFAAVSSIFDLVYFFIFKDAPIEALRTGWFVSSVLCELILVLSLRTTVLAWKGPKISYPLALALIASAALALALPYIPFISTVLYLTVLPLYQMSVILGLTILYFGVNEALKKLGKKSA